MTNADKKRKRKDKRLKATNCVEKKQRFGWIKKRKEEIVKRN